MNATMQRIVRNMWARKVKRKNYVFSDNQDTPDEWGHDSLVEGARLFKSVRKPEVRAYGRTTR